MPERSTVALHVAVAACAGAISDERLLVTSAGEPVAAEEVAVDHGGRVHVVRTGPGALQVDYRATVALAEPSRAPVTTGERLVALRQSRYCPSDAMVGVVETELAELREHPTEARAKAIAGWVHSRVRHELGSSGPLDTAEDTLRAGCGVCRDFAHLTITLCRAAGVPARLVAAYAPGLHPMDFHAVAEVAPGEYWEVIDATRLAPRPSLVRIATGRDAADTAFATTLDGYAELEAVSVTAVVDPELPVDDHTAPVAIP